MPYEGGSLKGGPEWKRLVVAVGIGTGLLVGAWALAAVVPAPTTSVDQVGMKAPSQRMEAAPATSDGDVWCPGESELAKHPVAAR